MKINRSSYRATKIKVQRWKGKSERYNMEEKYTEKYRMLEKIFSPKWNK